MNRLLKHSSLPTKNTVLGESMALLRLSSEFREDVESLRQLVGLPKGGLPFEASEASMRANQSFSSKLTKRTDDFFSNPETVKQIRALKKAYRLSTLTSEEFDHHLNQIERKAPLNALSFGVHDLLRKYRLSNSYRDTIHAFVMHNLTSAVSNNYTIETVGESTGPRDVCIRVTGPMTKREKKEAMDQATSLFAAMYPQFSIRFNKRRSISQDIRVFEAWIKRNDLKLKTSKSMGEYVWEDDGKTPLEKLGDASKKSAIRFRQSVHRLKEQFKKRFGRELV